MWSALPPLADPTYAAPGSARPITLVVAQVDSNSFFHDLTRVRAGVVCVCRRMRSVRRPVLVGMGVGSN